MQRSKHSLSHYRLTSLNMGTLFPVSCMEVLPGDTFRKSSSCLLRVSPLVSPVMHPVSVSIHEWFVPARVLWSNWEKFITGQDPALVLPTLTIASTDTAAIKHAQALGIGADVASGNIVVNALPFRAYNLIWNEFYRDKDLNTILSERTGDTGDLASDYGLRNVSWEKDYFTTARAYPQQGALTEVVPLTFTNSTLPVKGIGKVDGTFTLTNQTVRESDGTTPTYAFASNVDQNTASQQYKIKGSAASSGFPQLTVDLTGASAAGMDINAFRQSMFMQKMREHRNRYGSDYRSMLAFLGVRSSDARLQRPEYLGGGRNTIAFSEVLSTADTTTADIGAMAGHGIAAVRTRGWRRFFEEHGYVITLLSVRPTTMYVQSVPRHYLRRKYMDFWQKEGEMQGEQAITNFEVYGNATVPNGVFGYIPRYDEYRHAESSVSGEFRNLLSYWHLGRIFASQPVLNGSFVSADPSTRIYASTANDQLYAMVSHRVVARRLVSKRARS